MPAAAVAAPQEIAAAPGPDVDLPTAEALKDQLDAVEADETLAESIKPRLLTALRSTQDALKNLANDRERQANFTAAAQTASDRIVQARNALEMLRQSQPSPDPPIDLSQAAAVEQLRNRVSEAEISLNQARHAKQEWEDRQRERQTRTASLASLIADARTALADTIGSPIGEQTDDPHGTVREAREKQRLVAIAVARQRLATLQAEQALIEAEVGLIPLQIESAAATVKQAEERLKRRSEQLGRQRQYQIENDLSVLQQTAAESDEEVDQTAVWPLRQRWLDLSRENVRVRQQTTNYRAQHDALEATYREVSTEIQRDLDSREGLRSGLGLKLLRIRSRLPSAAQLRREAWEVDDRLELASEFQTLIDQARDGIGEFTSADGFSATAGGAADLAIPESSLDALQRTLLARMATDVETHINDLIDLKDAIELKRRKSAELRAKIEVNVIWIRDTARLRWSGLPSVWESMKSMIAPSRWLAAGHAVLRTVATRWDWILLWLLLAVVPLGLRWQRRIRPVARDGSSASPAGQSLWATLRQLLLSLYQSLPLPVTLMIAAALLASSTEANSGATSGPFTALADATRTTGWLLLPLAWLNQLLRPDGVVEREFRYTRDQTLPAYRAVRALLILGSPLCWLWQISLQPQWVDGDATLARWLFVLGMVLVALALRMVFHPGTGALVKHLRDQPDSWPTRLQWLWHTLPLLPLTLAVLSWWGYAYAATLLAERMHWSLWFALALLLTSGMLTRWVQLRRTDWLRQRESQPLVGGGNLEQVPVAIGIPQRTASAHPILPAGGVAAGGTTEASLRSVAATASAEIDAQTLRLLSALLWTAVLVGAAWLWTPVLPAVRFLDRVPLWDTAGADGGVVTITLANLVMALPIVFLTWVAARGVPGLIETVLLERLPLDRPARYAITSLVSYGITAIGILMAAQTIGIRWQSVQWLVAALGVGLGFGLQDIFSNFISGLILLFEQPIRVGDTVTIGNTTGTVSRIRMRATIVTNGERQELVIPNKNLITERLINWTLTDSVNRIEIRLGISHQADTQTACRLLEQICNQHDSLLVDPKPQIIFDSIGESSLTIVVQGYLGQLSQRAQTLHELNTTIKQRFEEVGIEIAHPQRDIHVRS